MEAHDALPHNVSHSYIKRLIKIHSIKRLSRVLEELTVSPSWSHRINRGQTEWLTEASEENLWGAGSLIHHTAFLHRHRDELSVMLDHRGFENLPHNIQTADGLFIFVRNIKTVRDCIHDELWKWGRNHQSRIYQFKKLGSIWRTNEKIFHQNPCLWWVWNAWIRMSSCHSFRRLNGYGIHSRSVFSI